MLPSFLPAAEARVLVVGDVILDRYLHGETTRISPEAPVPVVRVASAEERPGGAANVALNLRALGVGVELSGITGADAAADSLEAQLRAAGVGCRLLRRPDFSTIAKWRILSQHQQLLRLDYEQAIPPAAAVELPALCRPLFDGVRCLVLSDYAKGSLHCVRELISLAAAAGVPVLVDPKGSDFGRYRGATLLTPNLREFEQIAGPVRDPNELARRAEQLRLELDLRALLVTRGEQGMTLVQSGEPPVLHVAALAREVFDVTGAGDTVLAAMAASLVSGYPLSSAMQYANAAAGLVVAKLGAAVVTTAELNAALATPAPIRRGVLAVDAIAQEIAAARHRGERIVMTNGCFDVLHAGHVRYLEQARALGDRLLVAVNDDESVRQLKGNGRPLNALRDRMALLAALSCVDWVTDFAEPTPAALVERLAPDVLAKGGDYRPEQVAGGDAVRARGGQVVILPYVQGYSTSALVESVFRSSRRKD